MARNSEISRKAYGFLEHIKGRRLLIQTHDVPDPDALASAEALRVIAKEFGISARIYAHGLPHRRENKVLMKECKITVRPLALLEIRSPSRYAWAYVDCLPGGGNVTLHPNAPGDVFLAVDHHVTSKQSSRLTGQGYYLRYPDAGATATILGRILIDLNVTYPPRLASAISFAIITDTQDFSRGGTQADIDMYSVFFPMTNQKIISRLRNVSKPRQYFGNVHKSLANAGFYRHVSWVFIGEVESAEIVAEMADLILSCERITWSLALGYTDDRLYMSLRSVSPKARCGRIIHRIAGKQKGAVGGHDQFAGGYIELGSAVGIKDIADKIIARFIRIIYRIPMSMDVPEGTPLVENNNNYQE